MGLFCFSCGEGGWIYGVGAGVPDLIHSRHCPNAAEADAEARAMYPGYDPQRARDRARCFDGGLVREYAIKMFAISPGTMAKARRHSLSQLRYRARRGDLSAKRTLRMVRRRMSGCWGLRSR